MPSFLDSPVIREKSVGRWILMIVASDDSSYVNGTDFLVDGGLHACYVVSRRCLIEYFSYFRLIDPSTLPSMPLFPPSRADERPQRENNSSLRRLDFWVSEQKETRCSMHMIRLP